LNKLQTMSSIDFRIIPTNVPSLCIPRVFPNINEMRIRKIFDELNMGLIQRIDVVSKTTEKGEKFNRVFVHFSKWNNNETTNLARERLINGKEIKIIYDDPWFWKVSAYRPKEESTTEKKAPRPVKRAARISFDEDNNNDEFGRIPRQRHNNQMAPRQLQKPRQIKQQVPTSPMYSPMSPINSPPMTPREEPELQNQINNNGSHPDEMQEEEKMSEKLYNDVILPPAQRRTIKAKKLQIKATAPEAAASASN